MIGLLPFSCLFSIVLIGPEAAMRVTWGEDGEQNEKRGKTFFDSCQVTAAAWTLPFNASIFKAPE